MAVSACIIFRSITLQPCLPGNANGFKFILGHSSAFFLFGLLQLGGLLLSAVLVINSPFSYHYLSLLKIDGLF